MFALVTGSTGLRSGQLQAARDHWLRSDLNIQMLPGLIARPAQACSRARGVRAARAASSNAVALGANNGPR